MRTPKKYREKPRNVRKREQLVPVRNSLAHTVNAMLSKLKLCDPRTVPAGPDYGRILERNLSGHPSEPGARRFFSFPVFFIYWLFSENASKKPLRSPQRLSGPIGAPLEALKVSANSWMLLPPGPSAPS